jgi:hypothetical protein
MRCFFQEPEPRAGIFEPRRLFGFEYNRERSSGQVWLFIGLGFKHCLMIQWGR